MTMSMTITRSMTLTPPMAITTTMATAMGMITTMAITMGMALAPLINPTPTSKRKSGMSLPECIHRNINWEGKLCIQTLYIIRGYERGKRKGRGRKEGRGRGRWKVEGERKELLLRAILLF